MFLQCRLLTKLCFSADDNNVSAGLIPGSEFISCVASARGFFNKKQYGKITHLFINPLTTVSRTVRLKPGLFSRP